MLKFEADRMLVFLKDWSNIRITAVAAILVSILMIIPPADAVDALKTCACLLKDCRYAIFLYLVMCQGLSYIFLFDIRKNLMKC